MLLWKVRSRQVCKKPYRPKIDFIPPHATEAHQRKTYIKLTQSWRLNMLPHPQMDGPSCASSVAQTVGVCWGSYIRLQSRPPAPSPALSQLGTRAEEVSSTLNMVSSCLSTKTATWGLPGAPKGALSPSNLRGGFLRVGRDS